MSDGAYSGLFFTGLIVVSLFMGCQAEQDFTWSRACHAACAARNLPVLERTDRLCICARPVVLHSDLSAAWHE